jgi:hypothetical protein
MTTVRDDSLKSCAEGAMSKHSNTARSDGKLDKFAIDAASTRHLH